MDKIREKLRGHAPSDSMEVDGSGDPAGDIETLVNDCKFNMKLRMADGAQKQVKKQVWMFLCLFFSMLSHQIHPGQTNVFRITSP